MSLAEYIRKRNFRRTSEPAGRRPAKHTPTHRFVIQKHDASRLHYDFRLELGGTLRSWAIPKGIPFSKGEKRLAVHVEDHPISYIDFEGTIPKGQYGGGTVMLWDRGIFEPLSDSPLKDLKAGKLHFVLHGEKLEGEWYLVQIRGEDQWLLIRAGENMRPVSKKKDDTSVASGRSMKEIAAEKGGPEWKSDRASQKQDVDKAASKKKRSILPKFIEPMKARLVSAPPIGEWIYEIKFDGFRALGLLGGNRVSLLSRTQHDLTLKFPEIVASLREINEADTIVDGEIVALDSRGVSSFQLLQAFEMGQERPPIYFYIFDLPRFRGKNLQHLPLIERKQQLAQWLKGADGTIRYSDSLGEDPNTILSSARKMGVEGVIAKRKHSKYESGKRTGSWIKLKFLHEQEFVIGGYSNPGGSRHHFGALLLGYYEKKKFLFCGKVGTGFDFATLEDIHSRLQPLLTNECPFSNLPEPREHRYGHAITIAEMKRCHWVKPESVCQIRFSEWTRDGKLRQPVFLGMREDKAASEVIRERADQ